MIEYINENLSGFWISVGFAMLAAEVLLFGFTTIIFLFAGLGAIVTGLLMMSGILPDTWIAGTACFGISTGLSSILLWKPMQRLQNGPVQKKQNSDFLGLQFVLMEDISTTAPGSYRYSGIDWRVEVDSSSPTDDLGKGTRVEVVSLDVGVFRVKAL